MILCQCSELVQQDVAVHVQGLQTWKMMWRRRMTRTAGQAQVVHQLRCGETNSRKWKDILKTITNKIQRGKPSGIRCMFASGQLLSMLENSVFEPSEPNYHSQLYPYRNSHLQSLLLLLLTLQ